jgi:hypothetical protein
MKRYQSKTKQKQFNNTQYQNQNTQQKYIATMNLVRLSKGKMVGVNYNKTATWVGGSLAYFES